MDGVGLGSGWGTRSSTGEFFANSGALKRVGSRTGGLDPKSFAISEDFWVREKSL